jgi:hypothetical protein
MTYGYAATREAALATFRAELATSEPARFLPACRW